MTLSVEWNDPPATCIFKFAHVRPPLTNVGIYVIERLSESQDSKSFTCLFGSHCAVQIGIEKWLVLICDWEGTRSALAINFRPIRFIYVKKLHLPIKTKI